MDVFVVGGAGVDTIVRVPGLDLGARETVPVEPIQAYVGHTGHGVVLGCHLLGMQAGLADVIGEDDEGYRIRQLYWDLQLPLHFVVHPSGTRRSVNLVTPDGKRLSFYDGRHPAGLRIDPDLWRPGIAEARHVHVSIMDFARDALPDAVASGKTISTDLHDWDGKNDYHRDFATAADIVFVSSSALSDDAVDWIFEHGRAQAVVVLAGADGSYLHLRDEKPEHIPATAIPGRPVVDTNGAGDAYVAAFLARWLDGVSWHDAAQAGTIAGAWACGSAGTHTDLITAEELAARSGRRG